jgi:DNA repair protein RadC
MQALRTQLLAGDGAALGDVDLLTLLIVAAMPAREDPAALAREAIGRFGSFAALLAAPLRELQGFSGFGAHSLAAIKLMHEAALRLSRARMQGETVLGDPDRLIGYLTAVLAREKIEQFRILFLDEADRLIADEAQARGTVNHTPVYPREVVRRAIELEAAAIILVHNHPSGDPTPSRDDLAMTSQVVEAAAVLGVVVRDHVIVGNGRWTSFREAGLLGGRTAY